MENRLSLSGTMVLPPILRLPPEIRLMIYRLLLISDSTIRMRWMNKEHYLRQPNSLFPSVLSVCHLMHREAIDVLYGENVFRAHRIDESNKNAALITRAKYVIGISTDEKSGERDASDLAKFLDNHPKLKLLTLDFGWDLLEESTIREILSKVLRTSGYSAELTVLSDFQSFKGSLNATQIARAVQRNVALLEGKKTTETKTETDLRYYHHLLVSRRKESLEPQVEKKVVADRGVKNFFFISRCLV